MPKYKYIGAKPFIVGLNGQKFVKGVVFEVKNCKNVYELNPDFERVEEKKVKKKEKKKVKKKKYGVEKMVKKLDDAGIFDKE